MNHYSSDTETAELNATLKSSLREVTMLADLTIGVWSGERSDAEALHKLRADAGAKGKVGRVVKYLMAGADARLKDTKAAFAAVRTAHTALTQPWATPGPNDRVRGPRLLPNMLFQQYLDTVTRRKREAMAALDEMLAHYDSDVATARANLGNLADAVYPTADQVRAQCYVKIDFEPLPDSAGFAGLPERFVDQLAKKLRTRQEERMHNAQAHLWEVLRERVTHLKTRMEMVDAKFKSSTVESVRDLIGLLPAWNIAGDARVGEAHAALSALLDGVTAQDVRDDAAVRARVAAGAGALVARLDEWEV